MAYNKSKIQFDADEVRKTIDLFFEPGDVFEVRAYAGKTTMSGYFSDSDSLINAMTETEFPNGCNFGITLQHLKPEIICREQYNKFIDAGANSTTKDHDVINYKWMLIDIDPIRATGISATKEEVNRALEKAKAVNTFLMRECFETPVAAFSGNGIHLLYKTDFKADEQNKNTLSAFLNILSTRFTDNDADVDVSVFNPARISKLYGTVARKGANAQKEGRTHRQSKLLTVPEEIKQTDLSILQTFVSKYATDETVKTAKLKTDTILPQTVSDAVADVTDDKLKKYINAATDDTDREHRQWLAAKLIEWNVKVISADKEHIYIESPFADEYTSPAKAKDCCVFVKDSVYCFNDFHASGQKYSWTDFRKKVDTEYQTAEVISFVSTEGSNLPEICIDLRQFRYHRPPKPDDIIKNVWAEKSKMLIAGESKAGKSWSAIHLALSIASGGKWLNKYECNKGKVLFVNPEIDDAFFINRVLDVADTIGVSDDALDNIHTWTLRGYTKPLDRINAEIIDHVKQTGVQYKAIILDSIYKFMTGDENSAEDVGKLTTAMDEIITQTDAGICYVHHYSKGGSTYYKEARNRASGSGGISRDYDTGFFFDNVEIPIDVRNELEKSGAADMQPYFNIEDVSALRITPDERNYKTPKPFCAFKCSINNCVLICSDETGFIDERLPQGQTLTDRKKAKLADFPSVYEELLAAVPEGNGVTLDAIADYYGNDTKTVRRWLKQELKSEYYVKKATVYPFGFEIVEDATEDSEAV